MKSSFMTVHQLLISFSDVKKILAMGVGIRDPLGVGIRGQKSGYKITDDILLNSSNNNLPSPLYHHLGAYQ